MPFAVEEAKGGRRCQLGAHPVAKGLVGKHRLERRASEAEPRIRYCREDRIGLNAARECGWRAARSAIIAWTDDDCYVAEDYVDAVLAAFDGRPDVGAVGGRILLFDPDQVMRFKAWRGLSEGYRRAVEGHTPWTPATSGPQPIVVSDVSVDPGLAPYLPTIRAEGIAAMTFVPLVSLDRVIGKFMLYSETPRHLSAAELTLAGVIAAQVAFALDRTRAEEAARRSTELLRPHRS